MWNVNDSIKDAISQLKLSSIDITQLERDIARDIVKNLKSKYVKGNPRAWWMSLKKTFQIYDTKDDLKYLYEYVASKEEKYYFIPENERELIVYKCSLEVIIKILEECPFFEYYICPHNCEWLLLENDHDEVILAK